MNRMSRSFSQFIRYAAVGLASNGIGFLLYLLMTTLGFGSKVSMSLLYIVGVLQSFIFNRKWTFNYNGNKKVALFRYFLIYGFGYFINFGALVMFVDRFGYPHHWVQGGMILVVAVFIFVMQKIWVFRVQETYKCYLN
jgi:putative flippase GtrA